MSHLFRQAIKTDPAAQDRVRSWTADLRSGKYEQGFGTLRQSSRTVEGEYAYCCLGVACLHPDAIVLDFTLSAYNLLPPDVVSLYCLTDNCGTFVIDDASSLRLPTFLPVVGGGCSLAAMNDDGRRPFSEIADVIEYELNLALTQAPSDE